MTIEAMKQALEALDKMYSAAPDIAEPAVQALRTAIEQAEKRWSEFNETTKRNIEHADWYLSTHSAPEPVGVVKVLPLGDGHKPMHWADWTDDDNHPPEGTLLYTTPPAAPVQGLEKGCHRSHPHENMDAMCELRTEIARLTNENARLKAAAQRQWVGLTDEEIDGLYAQHHNQYGECESVGFGYERAIESKLREKNTA